MGAGGGTGETNETPTPEALRPQASSFGSWRWIDYSALRPLHPVLSTRSSPPSPHRSTTCSTWCGKDMRALFTQAALQELLDNRSPPRPHRTPTCASTPPGCGSCLTIVCASSPPRPLRTTTCASPPPGCGTCLIPTLRVLSPWLRELLTAACASSPPSSALLVALLTRQLVSLCSESRLALAPPKAGSGERGLTGLNRLRILAVNHPVRRGKIYRTVILALAGSCICVRACVRACACVSA